MSIIHDVAATLAVIALVVGVILVGVWLQLRHFRSELQAQSKAQWQRTMNRFFNFETSSESILTKTRETRFFQQRICEDLQRICEGLVAGAPESAPATAGASGPCVDGQLTSVAGANLAPGLGSASASELDNDWGARSDEEDDIGKVSANGVAEALATLFDVPNDLGKLIRNLDRYLDRRVAEMDKSANFVRQRRFDVRTRHSETSPSVDGGSSPTVGDGPVAEVSEEAPATEGTDTPSDVDTSPLVVYRTASLQEAISRRDAVFSRLRNLAAQPPSEFAYEKLPEIGQELHAEQLQVNRCAAQLAQARATEVARGGADDGPGKFSNRRRPGTRFSHPTPTAAPETPDAAQ